MQFYGVVLDCNPGKSTRNLKIFMFMHVQMCINIKIKQIFQFYDGYSLFFSSYITFFYFFEFNVHV